MGEAAGLVSGSPGGMHSHSTIYIHKKAQPFICHTATQLWASPDRTIDLPACYLHGFMSCTYAHSMHSQVDAEGLRARAQYIAIYIIS